MAREDENFRAYLAEHGYDVSLLGTRDAEASFQSDEPEKNDSLAYDDVKPVAA